MDRQKVSGDQPPLPAVQMTGTTHYPPIAPFPSPSPGFLLSSSMLQGAALSSSQELSRFNSTLSNSYIGERAPEGLRSANALTKAIKNYAQSYGETKTVNDKMTQELKAELERRCEEWREYINISKLWQEEHSQKIKSWEENSFQKAHVLEEALARKAKMHEDTLTQKAKSLEEALAGKVEEAVSRTAQLWDEECDLVKSWKVQQFEEMEEEQATWLKQLDLWRDTCLEAKKIWDETIKDLNDSSSEWRVRMDEAADICNEAIAACEEKFTQKMMSWGERVEKVKTWEDRIQKLESYANLVPKANSWEERIFKLENCVQRIQRLESYADLVSKATSWEERVLKLENWVERIQNLAASTSPMALQHPSVFPTDSRQDTQQDRFQKSQAVKATVRNRGRIHSNGMNLRGPSFEFKPARGLKRRRTQVNSSSDSKHNASADESTSVDGMPYASSYAPVPSNTNAELTAAGSYDGCCVNKMSDMYGPSPPSTAKPRPASSTKYPANMANCPAETLGSPSSPNLDNGTNGYIVDNGALLNGTKAVTLPFPATYNNTRIGVQESPTAFYESSVSTQTDLVEGDGVQGKESEAESSVPTHVATTAALIRPLSRQSGPSLSPQAALEGSSSERGAGKRGRLRARPRVATYNIKQLAGTRIHTPKRYFGPDGVTLKSVRERRIKSGISPISGPSPVDGNSLSRRPSHIFGPPPIIRSTPVTKLVPIARLAAISQLTLTSPSSPASGTTYTGELFSIAGSDFTLGGPELAAKHVKIMARVWPRGFEHDVKAFRKTEKYFPKTAQPASTTQPNGKSQGKAKASLARIADKAKAVTRPNKTKATTSAPKAATKDSQASSPMAPDVNGTQSSRLKLKLNCLATQASGELHDLDGPFPKLKLTNTALASTDSDSGPGFPSAPKWITAPLEELHGSQQELIPKTKRNCASQEPVQPTRRSKRPRKASTRLLSSQDGLLRSPF